MTPTPAKAERLSRRIQPLLHGQPPEIVGAVLGELVAMFVVGHHVELREEILRLHLELVRDLIPITEQEMWHQ